MNKEVGYGLAGLVIGVLLTMLVSSTGMIGMMGMHNTMSSNQNTAMKGDHMMMDDESMSMDDMVAGLKGKTGDEFDKAFISEMIVHHQGAIDMAKEAQMNAKHDEIKNLADAIITAQQKEINEMKQWQKEWGYTQ